MAGRKTKDDDLAQALEYIESLLKALRSRVAGAGVEKSELEAGETRFPGRNCRIAAAAVAGKKTA